MRYAESQGEVCYEFIFGIGDFNEGSCYWEHGPCDEYWETDYDLYMTTGMTWDPNYGDAGATPDYSYPDDAFVPSNQFEMRNAGHECWPNSDEDESYVGTYDTVQECYDQCVIDATALGKECSLFIFSNDGSPGLCYWEHNDCTELQPTAFDLY